MAKPRKPKKPPSLRPEGFTIDPAAQAEATIRERVNVAKSKLTGSRGLVHVYRDGSVDGEISVKFDTGLSVKKQLDNIQNAIGRVGFSGDVWVSMGVRYTIQKDEEIYRKYKGMNEVGVNYQRATRSNMAEEYIIMQKKVVRRLKKKYQREAAIIFIRFHWNPDNTQPSRY